MKHSVYEKQMAKDSVRPHFAATPCLQPEESSTVTDAYLCRPIGILVIDDERLLRNVIEKVLRKQGFAVWVAADGAAGVGLYRRVGAQIDVVLSDVQMPVWDGPKTLDALREINSSVRCCFMTGDTKPALLAQLMAQRPDGLFIKPFEVSEVVAALRELADQTTDNAESGRNSNCSESRQFYEAHNKSTSNEVESTSHRRVHPLLRVFAGLIALGEEWSAGLK